MIEYAVSSSRTQKWARCSFVQTVRRHWTWLYIYTYFRLPQQLIHWIMCTGSSPFPLPVSDQHLVEFWYLLLEKLQKIPTLSRTKRSKFYDLYNMFLFIIPENHTPNSGTSSYSQYRGVPPPRAWNTHKHKSETKHPLLLYLSLFTPYVARYLGCGSIIQIFWAYQPRFVLKLFLFSIINKIAAIWKRAVMNTISSLGFIETNVAKTIKKKWVFYYWFGQSIEFQYFVLRHRYDSRSFQPQIVLN